MFKGNPLGVPRTVTHAGNHPTSAVQLVEITRDSGLHKWAIELVCERFQNSSCTGRRLLSFEGQHGARRVCNELHSTYVSLRFLLRSFEGLRYRLCYCPSWLPSLPISHPE